MENEKIRKETPLTDELIEKLREFLLNHKKTKTFLASYLGTSKQRINSFFQQNKRCPNSETTLKLLEFLKTNEKVE